MNDLLSLVDWSRAQFALTAMYHWLFVPLTIGLSIIIAVMETIYYRTGEERWKGITKFWMTLFGINFACGVATGLILEFEFGTNWSNYSWFVGDIFGAPLAIEGILAFFMESTFVAVMFFGWNKVSRGFHLASTWLVALGVSLSALWILVANAWMQNPVGMEFDAAQMRNVMDDFGAVVFNGVAMNKFFHTVMSGWCLGGVFVVGVSCWLLLRNRNVEAAKSSLRIGAAVGLIGILFTMWTGHGSAKEVARVQPMKLAAMEGLYNGGNGVKLTAVGIMKPNAHLTPDDPMLFAVDIPSGLSYLINARGDSYVPGVNDLIAGRAADADGNMVQTLSYEQRMERGRVAREALGAYGAAQKDGDQTSMASAADTIKANFANFGYGYLQSPQDAVPPVALTFYAFHLMVAAGGALLVVLAAMLFLSWKNSKWLANKLVLWVGMLSIALVWICSEAGWVVAEVGRQPWVIQNLMPTNAAISGVESGSVQFTFWLFAVLFTGLLVAEISIMLRFLGSASKTNIEKH